MHRETPGVPTEGQPYAESARGQPSMSQEERPQRKATQPGTDLGLSASTTVKEFIFVV